MRSIGARGLYTFHACVCRGIVCILSNVDRHTCTLHRHTSHISHTHAHNWSSHKNRFHAKENWDNILCRYKYILRYAVLAISRYRRLTSYTYKCIELFEWKRRKRRENANVWVRVSVSTQEFRRLCDVTIKCKPLKCVRLALMDSYWNSNVLYFFLLSLFLCVFFFLKFSSIIVIFSLTADYELSGDECVCVRSISGQINKNL